MGLMDKKLSTALNIEPLSNTLPSVAKNNQSDEIIIEEKDQISPDHEEDYKTTRSTLNGLLASGNESLSELMDIAKQSDSPRAYEVVATMIKTLSETAKDLYDIQKKKKDLLNSGPKAGINVDKAVVFTGGASDLLKILKEKNKEND